MDDEQRLKTAVMQHIACQLILNLIKEEEDRGILTILQMRNGFAGAAAQHSISPLQTITKSLSCSLETLRLLDEGEARQQTWHEDYIIQQMCAGNTNIIYSPFIMTCAS